MNPQSSSTPTPEQVTAVPAAGASPNPSPAPAPLPGPLPTGAPLPTGSPFGSKSPFPGRPGFGGGSGGGGTSPLIFALVGLFGLGTVGFGLATLVFSNQAKVATTTLEQQKATAVAAAKKQQQADDAKANQITNESPYRSYVAPVEFGSFEIKFPKNWSSYVDQEPVGTQVKLIMNPDFVRRTSNTDELVAARIELVERTKDQYLQQYVTLIKRGILKQADSSVSGQKAYDITGAFADKKTTRIVVVPVRDKVLVFINENSKYASQFNEILAQSKVIP